MEGLKALRDKKGYMAINIYRSFVRAVTVALYYYNSTSNILVATTLRPIYLYITHLLYVHIQARELKSVPFVRLTG